MVVRLLPGVSLYIRLKMSNTYKDKSRGKFKRLYNYKVDNWKDWEKVYDEAYGYGYYNSCPKSWNKAHHIHPARCKERDLLKKIDIDDAEEYHDFPDMKKPHIYYW